MPLPSATPIALNEEDKNQLESLLRAGSTPQALVFRTQIVLRAAQEDCAPNLQIAAELGCSRHTVAKWREHFRAEGLSGLQDAPRSGRPPAFSP